jgi:hypothetical protein
MGLSLMNMLGLLSSVRIAHIACYWKFFFLVHYCQSRLCRADQAYLTYHMLQRERIHLNGLKLDHHQVQASYIFYVRLHLVLYYERVHSHNFAWLLLVSFTALLYNRIHTGGWKPRENRGPVCTLENFQWCGEPCFAGAAIVRNRCLRIFPGGANISHYWSDQCLIEG